MENRFMRFHPLVSFLYYAGSVVLLFLMLHPLFLGMGFIVILIVNFIHDRLNGIRRWLFFIITSVFFMVMLNPLFNERGRHVLFELGNHRFTLEAFVYGGMNAMSIIGVIAIFVSYNIVLTPNKLLFLFAKFMPQFAILLMLTLRFIPLMRRRVEEISVVQRSKGISVIHGKWKAKVKTGMQYVQVLLTYSLEEAIQTADSMKARGYGQGTRSSYEFFRFRKIDVFALVYLILLFCILIFGRFFGYGFFTVYPMMESWQLSMMDVRILVCYLLFLGFPLIVEVGEMFRWRLSN
jgi:energy-coupling factor transport system permease protein